MATASELCYLTQVVIRLFEDTQKPSEDPRRFRVEFLFSPGATSTPRHMAELCREKDKTRFDTEKLQKISIDGLTCAQVEEYFKEAIKEGKTDDEDDEDEVEKAPAEKEEKGNKGLNQQPNQELPKIVENRCCGATKNDTNNASVTDKSEHNNSALDSKDADHRVSVEKSLDFFRRPATVCGVVLGIGCLFMMSRASKGMLRR